MISITFFATLRTFLKTKQVRISAKEIPVVDLLRKCEEQISKPFLSKLLDNEGNITTGTIILINGQNILHLEGVKTVVKDGDEVALFPPGGGG